MFTLSKGYAARGMAAYSELQQKEFASEKDGYTATRWVFRPHRLHGVCAQLSVRRHTGSAKASKLVIEPYQVPKGLTAICMRLTCQAWQPAARTQLPGVCPELHPDASDEAAADPKPRTFSTPRRHQREVGTGYFDLVSTTVSATSSTTAMKESTEAHQF
jgi:hypothetical protein